MAVVLKVHSVTQDVGNRHSPRAGGHACLAHPAIVARCGGRVQVKQPVVRRRELLADGRAVFHDLVGRGHAHGRATHVGVFQHPHQEGLVEIFAPQFPEFLHELGHLGFGGFLGPIGDEMAGHRLHADHADVFLLAQHKEVFDARQVDLLGPLGQGHVVVGLEDEVHLARLDVRAVLGRNVATHAGKAYLALLLERPRGLVEFVAPLAVREVAVDIVGLEVLQAQFAGGDDILGRALAGGREDDCVFAPALQRPAEDLFGVVIALRRGDEVAAALEEPIDDRGQLLAVAVEKELAEDLGFQPGGAAQPDLGDHQPGGAEAAVFHLAVLRAGLGGRRRADGRAYRRSRPSFKELPPGHRFAARGRRGSLLSSIVFHQNAPFKEPPRVRNAASAAWPLPGFSRRPVRSLGSARRVFPPAPQSRSRRGLSTGRATG